MNLRENLESYRDITYKLIDKTKSNNNLDDLLKKRQEIINNIGLLKFNKEDFQDIINSLGIFPLEEELQKAINEEKLNIRNKINSINKTREARIKYENTQFKPSFFNKKI